MITAWWPECDLRAVPRVVPDGWTLETYLPGDGPVFRRTTLRYDRRDLEHTMRARLESRRQ